MGNDAWDAEGMDYMDKGVTIKEIAARAGVSTATVSNVIHGKTKRVSPETIHRVQELIRAMGYVRAEGSEKIKGRGSRLIAVLVNPHKVYEDAIGADPFYGKIIGMVERCLREKGYYMLFYSSSDMDDIFRMVMVQEVEGVITLSFNKNDCDKIAGLLKRPVVSIDAYGHQGNVPNVGLDDWQGGYHMTKYLLESGYGPVYVCAGRDHGVDHVRYMGCQDAERSAVRGTRQVCFTPLGMDRDKRRASFEALLRPLNNNISEGFRPAMFCLSDLYALEALNYYTARNIKVPEELGIAGFDDIFYASLSCPGLTTVRQDMKRKAELAVDRMADCLEGGLEGGLESCLAGGLESCLPGHEPDHGSMEILLPVKLVVRGTT